MQNTAEYVCAFCGEANLTFIDVTRYVRPEDAERLDSTLAKAQRNMVKLHRHFRFAVFVVPALASVLIPSMCYVIWSTDPWLKQN